MKKQCIGMAAAILAISLGATGAAAQGPAGVGGDQRPKNTADSQRSNSGSSHTSLGKWLKREDREPASDKTTTARAEKENTAKAQSSQARHSLNPVHWIKKDKNAATIDESKVAKAETAKEKKAESARLKAEKAESAKAAKVEKMNSAKTESAHAHHSLNPVKWIKKAPEQSAQKPDKAKGKNPSAEPAPPVASVATPEAN